MERNEKGQFVKGGRRVDITGKRYGRLTALRVDEERTGKRTYWICQCDCGNIIVTRRDSLENGHAKSCGCLPKHKCIKHGKSKAKIYRVWIGMKERCYNKNHQNYNNYGGRGITVCPEWLGEHGIENFIRWSYENGYKENEGRNKLTLDRKDVNGNYEPSNCRWADKDTQNYNKRCTRKIIVNGENKTILDLNREYGVSISTLRARYKKYINGEICFDELISKEKLVNKPRQILITVEGTTHNLTEWEKETGISRKTIANRYRRGIRSYEELFKKSR